MKTHNTSGPHGLTYNYWYDWSYRCWYACPVRIVDGYDRQAGNAVHAYDRAGILWEIQNYIVDDLYPVPAEACPECDVEYSDEEQLRCACCGAERS